MESTTLKIEGMTCGGCVKSVTRALEALPGVQKVEVLLEQGQAALTYDETRVGAPQFKAAIEDAGFELHA
jgi:copper chaperone